MWDIKAYNKKGKEIVLQSGFSTKEEADIFLGQEYKDKDDVFVVEKIEKETIKIDLTDKVGQWIWLYSPKKNEMFPYGILRDTTNMFSNIQTKEEAVEAIQMVSMRTSTIQAWIESGKGDLRAEGHFVTIKEYV